MKKQSPFYLVYIFLFCICLSCKIPLYVPVNEVVSSVSDKKELIASASFYSLQIPRKQVSLSYSPIKHMGLAFNRFIGSGQYSTGGAIGYYTNQYGDSTKSKFYDVYIGMSRGRNVVIESTDSGNFPSNKSQNQMTGYFNKYFVQAGIHNKNKYFFTDIYFHANIIDWSTIVIRANNYSAFPGIEKIADKDISINTGLGAKLGFDTKFFKIFAGTHICVPLYNGINVYDPLCLYSGIAFKIF